ncbi:MAG: NADH:ubiquinone reductase (Na(+)-transporting) subunit C [Rhodothermales bacterium]
MHSNSYTFLYALGVTALVAVALALAATGLRPLQEANEAQAKRIAILQSVMDVNPATAEADYNQYIEEVVVNASGDVVPGASAFALDIKKESKKDPAERQLPIFIYKNGDRTNYIVPLQGNGLWGPISAFLALDEDLNTVHGVVFGHEKETPGLGAEITDSKFEQRYNGKQLFDDAGTLQSIRVLKGSGHDTSNQPHAVDGLSGATMTSNGVTRMFANELKNYAPYFKKVRS